MIVDRASIVFLFFPLWVLPTIAFPSSDFWIGKFPAIHKVPVFGYRASSEYDNGLTESEIDSNSETDDEGGIESDNNEEPHEECASRVVVPPDGSSVKEGDTSPFDSAIVHTRVSLLKATAKSMKVQLAGTLRECKECLLTRGIHAPLKEQTSHRSNRNLGRVFVELTEEKEILGGSRMGL